ncbi:MAG: hypothetical protein LKJ18_01810 [Ancrocorticia sp.]|jgi:hypothetical protein|nr:hypothetical protein [Ancrocorticia sp.]MCI1962874.1 hypothetical protein [Ancrocorticia sp.]MCI2001846.1 hypothetical protein [Ancrocorticia sp.]MCI2001899.1 hypothetical protein [Ancrocorticia sp.]
MDFAGEVAFEAACSDKDLYGVSFDAEDGALEAYVVGLYPVFRDGELVGTETVDVAGEPVEAPANDLRWLEYALERVVAYDGAIRAGGNPRV